MKYEKPKKLKFALIGIMWFLIATAVIFIIVSLAISSVHDQTLIAEWQTWFGVAKESTEAVISNVI